MLKKNMWPAAMALIFAAMALAAAACGGAPREPGAAPGSPPAPAPPPAAQQPGAPPSAGESAAPGSAAARPGGLVPAPASPGMSALTYTAGQKEQIAAAASKAGVQKVFVPQQGALDDDLDAVEADGERLTLRYIKMRIVESPRELAPPAGAPVEKEEAVQLKVGPGQWITQAGQPTLYVKLQDTYIAVSSAKASKEELAAAADTLTPLQAVE